MALFPPPQNRTIGFAQINGQRVPVMVESAWFQYFAQGLYDRVGGANAPTNNELDSMFQFDSGESATAEISKGLRDLGAGVSESATAQVAELSKRVRDLEAALSEQIDLTAQLAQLRAEVVALQNEGAFL